MTADNNSLPQLLDMKLRVQQCEEDQSQKDVRIDLRVYCSEINGPEDCIISVRLKCATLGLNLVGLEAVPNSHLGEPLRDLKVTSKQTDTTRTTMDGKAAVKAGIDVAKVNPATLKLSAGVSAEVKVTSLQTSKQEVAEYRVKARPGDIWEVAEPPKKTVKGKLDRAPLDGTYLLNHVLCRVAPQRGANMMSVGVTAYARQRDMQLDLIKGDLWQTFMSKSQEKLFKILVAKSLGQAGNKYAGIVKLSHSEIEIEE